MLEPRAMKVRRFSWTRTPSTRVPYLICDLTFGSVSCGTEGAAGTIARAADE